MYPLLPPPLAHYLQTVGFKEPRALAELRDAMASHGQSRMMVDPEVGALLSFLVRLTQSQRVLEIGTFAGYSTLSMALALPEGGHITTLDHDQAITAIAHGFWVKNKVHDRITFHLGRALDTLATLCDQGQAYDLIFIDADKKMYDQYVEYAQRLLAPRGLIVIDNTLSCGTIVDVSIPVPEDDGTSAALRALNGALHNDPRFESVLLPIGDGVTLLMRL